jgi:cytochrome P450
MQITDTADYESFCAGRLTDPYPLFHRLQTEDPVHWCETWECWVLTRYDDVQQAHLNPHLSSDKTRAMMAMLPEALCTSVDALGQHLRQWVSHTDPPAHTRLRGLVSKAFVPRVIQTMRSRITAVTGKLIDAAIPNGRMELIRDFAYPLPVTVIGELLGIPPDDRVQFQDWVEDMVAFVDGAASQRCNVAERALSGLQELTSYFDQIITCKRTEPDDDLISMLLALEADGDRFTDAEVLAMCVQILVGGHDTTTGLISNGIFALLRHPNELERLQAHPELIETAVEEFLRFESPAPRNTRIATAATEIAGHEIAAGHVVALMVGAANHDPQQFPDPDRLDIGRRPNSHLAFGRGRHFCLGKPLARLEGQIAIAALLQRLPGLRLADEQMNTHSPWRQSTGLRLLESLPVTFAD